MTTNTVATSDASGARSLRSLARAAWIGWASFAVLNFTAGGRHRNVAIDVVAAVGTIVASSAVVRRPHLWRAAMHAIAGLATVGLLLVTLTSGGVAALGWWYLVAVPLFVADIGGSRAALGWCVVSVVAVIFAVTAPNWLGTEFVPTVFDRAFGGAVLICICTSFGWLARREVEARVQALVDAARATSDLLATISHEIRTPLHGILGIASVLQETSLTSDQRDLVGALHASGRALNRIVDDVLDVARVESGRLTIEPAPVDLMATIEDLVDLHVADASAKGVQLLAVVDGAEYFVVLADEMRVRQVLSNLVGNAIKFTTVGTVVIRAFGAEVAGRCELRIRVEDTGPGVPADHIERLFNRFEQLDAQLARLHGGTGLGLALARELTVRMGGTLDVERGRAVGACFEVRLAFPAASQSGVANEMAARRNSRALIVEGEAEYAEACRALAKALPDGQIAVADSTDEAVALARTYKPTIIVVGDSPTLDPRQALQILRSAIPNVPIVVAVSPANVASHAALARQFSGGTLRPVRRSRIQALFDESSLPPDAPAKSPRIGRWALVVDDDGTNRRILARLLEGRGWDFQVVKTGQAAVSALAERRFDVVLCDLHMPDLDGTQVVAHARAHQHASFFVAVTASVRDADRARCVEAGFDAFLRKPFERVELDEVLAQVTRRGRATASLRPPPSAGEVPAREQAGVDLVDVTRWDALRGLLGDEAAEALNDYLQAARGHLAVLRDAARDVADVERAAHTLASSSLTVGFRALSEAAREMEMTVRGMDVAFRCRRGEDMLAVFERSAIQLAEKRP